MFFQRMEKQSIVLLNQPVVLLLEVFEKGWKLFDLVDLTIKPNQSIVSCFQPIISLKILREFSFHWWICLKWFLTEYANSLNVFNQSLEIYIVCYMFLKSKKQFWEIQFDKFDLKFSRFTSSFGFSSDSGIGLQLYSFQLYFDQV